MLRTEKQKIWRLWIAHVLISLSSLMAGCAQISPSLIEKANQGAWVIDPAKRDQVGVMDLNSGDIYWMPIPLQSADIRGMFVSRSRRYLAFVYDQPKVTIYRVLLTADMTWQLQLYAELDGYRQAQWSPDSDELLLTRTNWSGPVIWRAETKGVEEVLTGQPVCSSSWGADADQVVVAICFHDRQLALWSRRSHTLSSVLTFSIVVENDYAVFPTIVKWSTDHRQLLLLAHMSQSDLTGEEADAPVLVRGRYLVLDMASRQHKVISDMVDSTDSALALWLDKKSIFMVSSQPPEWPNPPKTYTYTVVDVASGRARILPIPIGKESQRPNAVIVGTAVVVVGFAPGEFYRLDLAQENWQRIDAHYDGKLSLLHTQ